MHFMAVWGFLALVQSAKISAERMIIIALDGGESRQCNGMGRIATRVGGIVVFADTYNWRHAYADMSRNHKAGTYTRQVPALTMNK